MADRTADRRRRGRPPAGATRAGPRGRPARPGLRGRPRWGGGHRTRTSPARGRTRSRPRRGAGRPRAPSPGFAGEARLGARDGFARFAQPVTYAADRLDELFLFTRVELAPQGVDVNVDDVRREVERVLPDARLDLGARDDLSAPPQEQLEESALAGGQADDFPATPDLARFRVVGEITIGERPRLGRLGAPRKSAKPREQLAEGERLHEVVVGARVEAFDLVLHGVARS